MFCPRIIPVLLLKKNGLVKTVKFGSTRYIGDPINAVKIFNDFEADELIFLDIDATKQKKCISKTLVKDLGDEAFMPFAVGGGIQELGQIENLLKAGAEKVILNTSAYLNPKFIREACDNFGSQSIVVSIDVKKNVFNQNTVRIKSGTFNTKHNPVEYAKNIENFGAGEIMITSINRDGIMKGYDIDLIRSISESVKVPVIACGGAGNIEDLKNAYYDGKATALAAGSLFVYHGQRKAILINYPNKKEIVKIFNDKLEF
ncbi:MAG: imidazole glycerol phosphate synthase subunit HisF [Phycisphaerae bacterium]|nr:imidazole glycerol phosphate synthase subunit HisF [Phycisphaerae bacterium]|tara:strand:- start:147 stop:923 length:777 start_codon:yes stop_codon:yes gene_type:complete